MYDKVFEKLDSKCLLEKVKICIIPIVRSLKKKEDLERNMTKTSVPSKKLHTSTVDQGY